MRIRPRRLASRAAVSSQGSDDMGEMLFGDRRPRNHLLWDSLAARLAFLAAVGARRRAGTAKEALEACDGEGRRGGWGRTRLRRCARARRRHRQRLVARRHIYGAQCMALAALRRKRGGETAVQRPAEPPSVGRLDERRKYEFCFLWTLSGFRPVLVT